MDLGTVFVVLLGECWCTLEGDGLCVFEGRETSYSF